MSFQDEVRSNRHSAASAARAASRNDVQCASLLSASASGALPSMNAPSLPIVTSAPLTDWPFFKAGKTAAEADQRYDQEDCPEIHLFVPVVDPLPQN